MPIAGFRARPNRILGMPKKKNFMHMFFSLKYSPGIFHILEKA
jgi:hypothetical protein